MKEFAYSFYNSSAWKKTRAAYAKSRRNLCEACLDKGIIRGSEIVHHRIPITPDNINDPSITLDWSNLCCLCRDCHAEVHEKRHRRFTVDELGRVTARD